MKQIIAILSLTAFLLVGCSKNEHQSSHHEHVTPKLEVTYPTIIDTLVPRTYVGQIHASRHIELRALERGYLQEIYVDEGQTISKGQSMFKIMPNLFEAELQKAQAEADAAAIEFRNTEMLAEKNVVSANELALAKAHLDMAKAEVSLATTHLNFTDIKAPFSGIMDHLHAREGSLLDEGELLTTISDNSKMWVYFNVPEAEYLDYASSDKKKSSSIVQLVMANGKVFSESGKMDVIEGEFDHETGNIEFRATFPNPKRLLRHGETGNVIMFTPYKDALIIPQKATFEILDKKYVYIVNEENKLEQRKITVAAEFPHLYIVDSGLDKHDKVLLEGLRRVRNNDEIEVNLVDPQDAIRNLELYAE